MTTVASTNPQEAKQVSNPQDAKMAEASENPQDARSLSKLLGQTVTDKLGISQTAGWTPKYPLHVDTGTVRFELGERSVFSLGPDGDICVDKTGTPAGRLMILQNGNVGINQNHPQATLDVNGTI